MSIKKSALLACCTAISLSSYASSGLADSTREKIRGAWEVEVTLRFEAPDCTSAPVVPDGGGARNPFPTMYTYQYGGTMNEFGSRASPAHRTPGHGVWKRSGSNTFATQYTFLTFDGSEMQDAKIEVSGNMTVTGDGNTLSGVARYRRTDISGNSIGFCATIAGERITF